MAFSAPEIALATKRTMERVCRTIRYRQFAITVQGPFRENGTINLPNKLSLITTTWFSKRKSFEDITNRKRESLAADKNSCSPALKYLRSRASSASAHCATGVLVPAGCDELWNGNSCSLSSQLDHSPEPLNLNSPIPQSNVVKLTFQLHHCGTRPLTLPHVEAGQSPSSEGSLLKCCMVPPVSVMWAHSKHGVSQSLM